jgi:CBS domain containing-hemolysin-like protein
MTPRTSISAISVTADLSEVLDAFKETGYSRLPLYRDSLESIIGIVHYKDILFYSLSPDGRPDGDIPEELVRKIRFVPETQGTAEFLREMRAHNLNMAIVIDEHGMTAGLVTLDDAVTAVFGSIKDEYDSDNENPDEKIQILGKGHIRIPGDLKLTDFNTLVKTNLESDWYETIGGFILEKTDRLPEKGSSIPCGSITFIIEEVADRTIRRMSVYFEEQSI